MRKIIDKKKTTNEADYHIWVNDKGVWLRFTEDAYIHAKESADKNPEDKPKVGFIKKMFYKWF